MNMKKKFFIFAWVLLLLLALFACTKEYVLTFDFNGSGYPVEYSVYYSIIDKPL
jgi:uncharacterized lipoprotein YehR (DUF1307 family)